MLCKFLIGYEFLAHFKTVYIIADLSGDVLTSVSAEGRLSFSSPFDLDHNDEKPLHFKSQHIFPQIIAKQLDESHLISSLQIIDTQTKIDSDMIFSAQPCGHYKKIHSATLRGEDFWDPSNKEIWI